MKSLIIRSIHLTFVLQSQTQLYKMATDTKVQKKYPQEAFKHKNGSRRMLTEIMKTDIEMNRSGWFRKMIAHYFKSLVKKGEISKQIAKEVEAEIRNK